MTTSDFSPTHEIYLTDLTDGAREEIPVHLIDGAAYTREEWDSETKADWTCTADGDREYGSDQPTAEGWLFQGRATPRPGLAVSVRRVEIEAAAEQQAEHDRRVHGDREQYEHERAESIRDDEQCGVSTRYRW